jgi:hypothetical protein
MNPKCSFCGLELTDEKIEKACQGCGAFGGCRLVRCPRCGYEQPQEPAWLKKVLTWAKSRKQPAKAT